MIFFSEIRSISWIYFLLFLIQLSTFSIITMQNHLHRCKSAFLLIPNPPEWIPRRYISECSYRILHLYGDEGTSQSGGAARSSLRSCSQSQHYSTNVERSNKCWQWWCRWKGESGVRISSCTRFQLFYMFSFPNLIIVKGMHYHV